MKQRISVLCDSNYYEESCLRTKRTHSITDVRNLEAAMVVESCFHEHARIWMKPAGVESYGLCTYSMGLGVLAGWPPWPDVTADLLPLESRL